MYDDAVWGLSPMNATKNVNGIGDVARYEVYDLSDEPLTAVQEAMTRKIVQELNSYDNVYFEICNEPYERAGQTVEWHDRIIQTIVDTEAALPKRHLIAQGLNRDLIHALKAGDVNRHVSVANLHYGSLDRSPLNLGLNRVVAIDETGGVDDDRKYRSDGWIFLLSGGGVYDHLDFSFTTARPDGSAIPLPEDTPGGGGPALRQQLRVLKQVIEGFDFIRMAPDQDVVEVRAASDESPLVRALVERGNAYAIYVLGGTDVELRLDLPAGEYAAEWVDTKSGEVVESERLTHAGGKRELSSPTYVEDIALRVIRVPPPDRRTSLTQCRLELTVVEEATSQPVACRITLTNSLAVPERGSSQLVYLDPVVCICDGVARLDLAPGRYTYEIERGPEYLPRRGMINFSRDGEQAPLACLANFASVER
jgi:hypothetical protein